MSHRDDEFMSGFDSDADNSAYRVELSADGHVTEESIYAWIDGALDANGSTLMQQHVTACRSCAEAVAEARGYVAASVRIMNAADLTPHNVVSRNVVSRDAAAHSAAKIVALADRMAAPSATNDSATGTTLPARAHRAWYDRTAVRTIAAMLLVAAGVYSTVRDDSGPIPGPGATENSDPVVEVTQAPSQATNVPAPSPVRAPAVQPKPSRPSDGSRVANTRPDSAPAAQPQPLRGFEIVATPPASSTALSVSVASVTVADSIRGRTVRGIIRERSTNEPLQNVMVTLPGVKSVATDSAGRFMITDLPDDARSIQFRRIGYKAVTGQIDSGSAQSMEITLERDHVQLSSVVTTGVSDPGEKPPKPECTFSTFAITDRSIPLVTQIELRMLDGVPRWLTLAGWPRKNDKLPVDVAQTVEGKMAGKATRGGVRLEIELDAGDDLMTAIVREHRNGSVRSENLQYRLVREGSCQ